MQTELIGYIRDTNGSVHACVVVTKAGNFGVAIKHPKDLPNKQLCRSAALAKAKNGHNKVPFSSAVVVERTTNTSANLAEHSLKLLQSLQNRAQLYFK